MCGLSFYALKRSNQVHKLYTAAVVVLSDKLCDIWLCHWSDLYRFYVALFRKGEVHIQTAQALHLKIIVILPL